jgi:hypothetical protein
MQAQQLIEEHETQKQLAELPLIQMPIMSTPTMPVIEIICFSSLHRFIYFFF